MGHACLAGVAGEVLALSGTLILVTACPIVSLLTCGYSSAEQGHAQEQCMTSCLRRWFLHTRMDSSVSSFVQYARKEGLQGLLAVWPRPSSEAWAYIAAFGVVQALMQLFVPGKVVKGPVTPKGNVPVYVVRAVLRQVTNGLALLTSAGCT